MYEFDFWRDIPIVLAAPAQTAFFLIYSLKLLGAGPWWYDFVGRALFLKSTTLMFLVDAVTCSFISHAVSVGFDIDINYSMKLYAGWDAATVTGYWLVGIAIYYQLFALIRQRRQSKRHKHVSTYPREMTK
jgi:hypothetical protein